MSSAVLEVIVCCVADAVEAQKGGASRLEVVRELDRGGLTPSIQLVQAIKDAVDLPLRVMVRESDGYGTRNDNCGTRNDNFGTRDDGYGTRNDNFGTRDDGYGTRNDNFGTRDDGYGTRNDNFGARDDGYGTRNDNFGARDDGYGTRNDNFGARDDGCGVRNEAEVERLCLAAREFAKLRVDGLVLGFLKNDQIDLDLTARVLACAPETHATFHHAFENASDQQQAVLEIKKLPQVDRILSHGGSGDLHERAQRLDRYVQIAAPEITIIAGGGLDLDAIALLKRTTSGREVHVGRAVREGFQVNGGVRADLVRSLVRAIETND